MKKHYPVMWFEGMPVGPETYQQQSLYFEQLIRTYSKINNPLGWGIKEAELDLTSLSEGFFKVKKITALNQNFFLFEVDESDDLKINLKDFIHDFKNDKNLFVYLSVPKNNYTAQINENSPKFSAEYKEVHDLNEKEKIRGLSFLKTNYFLEINETYSLKNESIPIAQIRFNGMAFHLTSYAFPTQCINNLTKITSELKELIVKMKDKVKYLKNIKKLSSENYIQLSNVSNLLFPLEAAIASNDHPYNIYKLLVEGVAASFNFTKKTDLLNIEAYNHQDIKAVFNPLINYINASVDTIFESFQLLKFAKNKNSFEIQLNNIVKNYILIAIEKTAAINYEDLSNWISTSIIATNDKIESIKEQRSRGADRFKVENYNDFEIQEIPDMVIVKIQIKEAFITENGMLNIVNNNENLPIPAAIFLIES